MRMPDENDYDEVVGRCTRRVHVNRHHCVRHASFFPVNQDTCDRRHDMEQAIKRMIERLDDCQAHDGLLAEEVVRMSAFMKRLKRELYVDRDGTLERQLHDGQSDPKVV